MAHFENKYKLYEASVQDPDQEISFFNECYREQFGSKPKTLREDFCGTYFLLRHWVKQNDTVVGVGIDLDPKPLKYGKKQCKDELTKEQSSRLKILEQNVLHPIDLKPDITCALNFSYFTFKKREDLKHYFKTAYDGLSDNGLLIMDLYGGSELFEPETTVKTIENEGMKNFDYVWQQTYFNPISLQAKFSIHFDRKGSNRIKNAFSYDWRLWSIPELREILTEAGFDSTLVYWEGDDDEGSGSGEFQAVEEAEGCAVWIAYVVGVKK